MKTKFAIAMLTLASAFGFAQEAPIEQPSAALPLAVAPAEKAHVDKSFTYVRMGISDNDAIHSLETLPGFGVGYRYAIFSGSIDVSANFTRQFGDDVNSFYTAPRVSYLLYFSPAKEQSFYYGAGAAWGGLKRVDADAFQGLVANATLGYEFNRTASIRSFVQLDASQPALAIAAWDSYSIKNLPTALAEVSFGLGF